MSTSVNRSKIGFRLLKIIFLAVVAVIFLFMLGFFVISYKVVGALSESKKTAAVIASPASKLTAAQNEDVTGVSEPQHIQEDQTSKETKISDTSWAEKLGRLGKLESVRVEMEAIPRPGICEVLCQESSFNYDKHKDGNPIDYLTSLYARDGDRSFEDPKFRMVLEMGLARFTYFTPNVRKLLVEMEDFLKNSNEMSRVEQAIFAARIQAGILESLYFLKDNQTVIQDRLDRVKEVKKLRKLCDEESRSEIFKKCQEIAPDF